MIDQKIAGHVSFMGKNGIKGEVIMRNGQILGWAWGQALLMAWVRASKNQPVRKWVSGLPRP